MKAMTAIIAASWRAIVTRVDQRDLMMAVGLAMLGFGAATWWSPAGLMVPGAVLTIVSIFGVRA